MIGRFEIELDKNQRWWMYFFEGVCCIVTLRKGRWRRDEVRSFLFENIAPLFYFYLHPQFLQSGVGWRRAGCEA